MNDDNKQTDPELNTVQDLEVTPEPETTPDTTSQPAVSEEELALTALESEPDSTATPTPEPEESPKSTKPTPLPIVISIPNQKTSKNRKRLVVPIIASVLVVAAVAVWVVLANTANQETADTTDQTSQPTTTDTSKQQSRLGVAATVIDGTVTYQKAADVQTSPTAGDGPWQALTTETELKEGDQVRTGEDSRVVLTLDDGSALRLDANALIRLTSLAADDVKVTQLAGAVYSRVVTSDRKYTVTVNDTAYQALGTAFMTVRTDSETGVQVYQSSVKTGEHTVSQGKQFYAANPDANLQGKVTDLDIDKLADNSFIAWNLTEDEKDTKFKDKLGVLPDIKKRTHDKAEEKKAEEERKAKEKEAADKAAKEEAKKKDQSKPTEKVTRGTMSLSLSGEQFKWSYTGKAVHGYKLLFSYKNTNPTFNGPDTQSIYFTGMNQLSGTLPGKDKIPAGTYYVRVCAYTAGTEAERCVDYSPVVSFTRS